MDWTLPSIINYTIAFSIVTFLGVYMVRLPHIISDQPELVADYYKKNWIVNIPLDYFLVLAYFAIAGFIWKRLGIEKTSGRLLVLVAITVAVSGSFYLWFNSRPETSSFFSQWFHRAGFAAVIYDVVLLSAIYLIYVRLQKSL